MAAATPEMSVSFADRPEGNTKAQLLLDGRSVSHAYIIPLTIRVGAATLRMDGIGGVETDEEHRKRGYSRLVLRAAVERMRAGPAALSTLYGIPDYYPKFGYATVGPEHTIRLPAGDACAHAPEGWRSRAFAPPDLPSVRRLYDQGTAGATGAIVRAQDFPVWSRLEIAAVEQGGEECRVVENPDGEVAAYAWRSADSWWMEGLRRDYPETLLLAEAFAAGPIAADALLAACREWADGREVELAMPPEGPVAVAAMLGAATVGRRFTRAGEFMGRTLGVRRLLTALLPELEARRRSSGLDFQGVLPFETDEGSAALRLSRDHVAIEAAGQREHERPVEVRLPQFELARLALGAFSTRDLLARLPDPPDDRALDILEALFPQRYPHVYPADRF